jgi:hypothetical protein
MTLFGLKGMVKSGLEKFILKFHLHLSFRVAADQCRQICPEGLNWPSWLAGISEEHALIEIISKIPTG